MSQNRPSTHPATARCSTAAAALALLVLSTGCGQTRNATEGAAAAASPVPAAARAAQPPLVGTRWKLREIQSADDTIGTTRPEDPTLYTLTFNDDGSLAMRLNCNRGFGPWKATPSATDTSGSITIGPLGVTRALCPPPSLDERIARDMDRVRGYFLRDGLLSLSLMADAGTYIWEPMEADDEGQPDPGRK
jgi:heat shock protein HslJ